MLEATQLLVWGSVIHLVVDWLFQNEWMALNKAKLRHPSGYLHSVLHGAALLLVFPPVAAAGLAVAHFAIDTRRPLGWWSRVVSQTKTGPMAVSVISGPIRCFTSSRSPLRP
jgi:hypothetical protein